MCIDMQHRSLKGGVYDKMYEYFEKNNMCKKYVENTDFQDWMRGWDKKGDLGTRAVKDQKAFEELVESVETFVDNYNWKKDLDKLVVTGTFQLLQEHGFLDGVENFRTFKVCEAMLYLHLGMIVLDRIRLTKVPSDSHSR